ncbi:hypothetical protein BU26DRAFT_78867 [Trematosphaeria pertusa]|uniref:Uncharacterized protein n=1 Tax=Trematosphaeria pertusa TaxID=390896 RepID=A0A6A6I6Q8_9PLEO|nr:uncharacterized protein BU26DRAFT_78867 [Trematosphaeria pertusa]KAF2245220.1 hypothetical protein BU26DRAFT_78867 [Trematosphaeria pertusa]
MTYRPLSPKYHIPTSKPMHSQSTFHCSPRSHYLNLAGSAHQIQPNTPSGCCFRHHENSKPIRLRRIRSECSLPPSAHTIFVKWTSICEHGSWDMASSGLATNFVASTQGFSNSSRATSKSHTSTGSNQCNNVTLAVRRLTRINPISRPIRPRASFHFSKD